MALYGFLFYLVYTLMRSSPLRSALLTLLGALIGLVGLSRVYLGAHWASDVFGGYCLGFFWLALTIYFYRSRKGASGPA
jgi:undecaprenyl-diphosphatase